MLYLRMCLPVLLYFLLEIGVLSPIMLLLPQACMCFHNPTLVYWLLSTVVVSKGLQQHLGHYGISRASEYSK
jgi:hypothetical protein